MIAASVEVCGPCRDLHSGNDGGEHPLKTSKVAAEWLLGFSPLIIRGLFVILLRFRCVVALPCVTLQGACSWSEEKTTRQSCCLFAAGVFNEPLSDLMRVLASLVDSQNRILVPGFHDKVCALW